MLDLCLTCAVRIIGALVGFAWYPRMALLRQRNSQGRWLGFVKHIQHHAPWGFGKTYRLKMVMIPPFLGRLEGN